MLGSPRSCHGAWQRLDVLFNIENSLVRIKYAISQPPALLGERLILQFAHVVLSFFIGQFLASIVVVPNVLYHSTQGCLLAHSTYFDWVGDDVSRGYHYITLLVLKVLDDVYPVRLMLIRWLIIFGRLFRRSEQLFMTSSCNGLVVLLASRNRSCLIVRLSNCVISGLTEQTLVDAALLDPCGCYVLWCSDNVSILVAIS